MEEAIYQKIELFLNGEMSNEDALQFEEEIKNDENLQSEVALYKAINLHFSDEDDMNTAESSYKTKIDAFINSEEGASKENKLLEIREKYHNDSKRPKSKNRVIYFLVSTAAIFGFIFWLFIFESSHSSTELYAEYYSSKDLPSFTNRSDESLLSNALGKFNASDYEGALSDFKSFQTKNEKINPLMFIYTGIIQSELGNLNEAILELEKLEKIKIEDSSRALWYKALIYLKFEEEDKAKNTLKIILNNKTNYKYKEAKELFEKI